MGLMLTAIPTFPLPLIPWHHPHNGILQSHFLMLQDTSHYFNNYITSCSHFLIEKYRLVGSQQYHESGTITTLFLISIFVCHHQYLANNALNLISFYALEIVKYWNYLHILIYQSLNPWCSFIIHEEHLIRTKHFYLSFHSCLWNGTIFRTF